MADVVPLSGLLLPPPDNPAAPSPAVADAIRAMAGSLMTLPARVAGASEDLRTGNGYDPAPAVEAASMMTGVGAPFAQAGAAGIFGGRLAAENLAKAGVDQPKIALAMADHMAAQGATKEDIYAVTNKMLEGTPYAGVHAGADGKFRFEIPDERLSVREGAGMGIAGHDAAIHHPEVAAAYGDMPNLFHVIEPSSGQSRAAYSTGVPATEQYFGRDPEIRVYGRDLNDARSLTGHELQHAIQEGEGFAEGANFHEVGKNAYLRSAGEVEARNVQKRLNMTPAERRASPPWETEDVPRDQQIVRGATPLSTLKLSQ